MLGNNDLVELTQDQDMDVDGGVGLIVGVVIGLGVAWVADGILIATTGKSGGEWVATVLNPPNRDGGFNAAGYRGATSLGGSSHSSAGYAF